jgi:MFS transporter, DHA1 family, inner membrane transport protein
VSTTAPWVLSMRALMAGNFAIGCGVMLVQGALNDLSRSLQVSPAVGGQLITAGAVAMGVGAPLMAALLGGWDRRRLLCFALLWYAIGHLIAAAMPSFAALLPVRVLSVLAAAVFTPQAAAAINLLAPAEQRGRAITMVFMGWSISSVLGMPLNGYIAETAGWRWAFVMVSALAALGALGVWRFVPDGVRSPPLSLKGWGAVLSNPLLMGMVGVTALSSAGHFTVMSYFAPYFRDVLLANAVGIGFLFFWFGAFAVLGNVLLTRHIDRLGPARCVNTALSLVAFAMLCWPLTASAGANSLWLATTLFVPWALGLFSCNSAQQSRLAQSALAGASDIAPALLALNTSAIYVGQALGAGSGGALLAAHGFAPLSWAGLSWILMALALSLWATRRAAADVATRPAQTSA